MLFLVTVLFIYAIIGIVVGCVFRAFVFTAYYDEHLPALIGIFWPITLPISALVLSISFFSHYLIDFLERFKR